MGGFDVGYGVFSDFYEYGEDGFLEGEVEICGGVVYFLLLFGVWMEGCGEGVGGGKDVGEGIVYVFDCVWEIEEFCFFFGELFDVVVWCWIVVDGECVCELV